MNEQELVHDWNASREAFDWSSVKRVELDDETLRDGLQNPSVVDPPIEKKIRLLHLMDELGIHTADIGLPGAGPRAVEAVEALAEGNATRSRRPGSGGRDIVGKRPFPGCYLSRQALRNGRVNARTAA